MSDPVTSKLGLTDPRVDRAITWGLTSLAAVAFSIGGYTFSGLTGELHSLRDELGRVGSRIAVIESWALDARLRAVEQVAAEKRLEALERWQERQEAKK